MHHFILERKRAKSNLPKIFSKSLLKMLTTPKEAQLKTRFPLMNTHVDFEIINQMYHRLVCFDLNHYRNLELIFQIQLIFPMLSLSFMELKSRIL